MGKITEGEEIVDVGGELQSVPDGSRSRALRLPLYSPLACKPILSSVSPHPRGISRFPILSPTSAWSGHRSLPPSNLSTSGQPHLLACPQDINRIQRLVFIFRARIYALMRHLIATVMRTLMPINWRDAIEVSIFCSVTWKMKNVRERNWWRITLERGDCPDYII